MKYQIDKDFSSLKIVDILGFREDVHAELVCIMWISQPYSITNVHIRRRAGVYFGS
jgi:hypothetical protein